MGLYISLVIGALVCLPWAIDAFGMVKVAASLLGVAAMWASGRANRTEMDGPIAALSLALLASAALSVSPWMSLVGFQSQPFYGLLALSGAALLFYATNASEWKEGPALCCAVVAIATGVACAVECFGLGLPPFNMVGGDRAVGTIGSPVFMGTVMAVCVPVCAWLASKETEHWRLGTIAVLCAMFAMAASGSRGPWLAAGCGMVGYYFAAGHLTATRRVKVWLSVAVLACVVLMFSRLDMSDLGRYQTWLIAFKGGFKYPVFGWGPDTFFVLNITKKAAGEVQASAHNDILQFWATTGIVGLSAYLWAWHRALLIAWKAPPVFGSLIALFVAAKFNPVPPAALYLCAALLGSIAIAGKPSRAIWAIGAVVLLFAPGMAVHLVAQDGAGVVRARVR